MACRLALEKGRDDTFVMQNEALLKNWIPSQCHGELGRLDPQDLSVIHQESVEQIPLDRPTVFSGVLYLARRI